VVARDFSRVIDIGTYPQLHMWSNICGVLLNSFIRIRRGPIVSRRVKRIPAQQVQRYPFVVNETPYCIWDSDIAGRDLEFLNMIDPAYFDHVAASMGNLLPPNQVNRDSDDKDADDARKEANDVARYAAVTLRTTYSHGLETFFALVGATVQANRSVAGWMLKYKLVDLEELVRKIHRGEAIKTRITTRSLSWELLAEALTPVGTGDADKDARMRQHFGRLWRRLAHDFLNKDLVDEYNSIKHGLRVNMRGFYLALGLEDIPGVPAPPENMRLMGSSQFGNYTSEKLHDSRNFRILRKSRNWNPWKFVYALQLISMSINNIVSTLKMMHGVPGSEALCTFPDNEELFDLPWKQRLPGMTTFSMNPHLTESMVTPMTKDEILKSYDSPPSEADT
jgi:hypothetical protein